MFAIAAHGARPRAIYTHRDLAQENLRGEAEEVIEIADDMDTTSVVWDALARDWSPANVQLSPVQERRQSSDWRIRRAQAYSERIDRSLQDEVVVDIVLTLAADPDFFVRLRPTTQAKLNTLTAVIEAVKADHRPR